MKTKTAYAEFEKIVGNIIATILILILLFSVAYSIFALLFRDGAGLSLQGSRGQFYMIEAEDPYP